MPRKHTVLEFLRALFRGHTYDIRRNSYIIFGILWGIPIPIVTIGIGLHCLGETATVTNIVNHVVAYPINIFFIFHPLIFGIVFGAMGTIRADEETQKLIYEKNIIDKNEELFNTNARLRELDKMKDTFLSMVTHELKNPLATVKGYISFLKTDKESGVLSAVQKHALRVSEDQIDHLDYLISELVDLSMVRSGKFDVEIVLTDLTDTINKVIERFSGIFDKNGITFEKRIPVSLSMVMADPKRIFQVINNLLENAAKFTESGGKVTVGVEDKDKSILFRVSDTGIGIEKENLDKIFDKFYQIGSYKQGSGLGLGLAISQNIIEKHKGGRIWVESEPGAGSTFFFEIGK